MIRKKRQRRRAKRLAKEQNMRITRKDYDKKAIQDMMSDLRRRVKQRPMVQFYDN